MRALNRYYRLTKDKKKHPAAKCRKARCTICHSGKVMDIPTKKTLQEKDKMKFQMESHN